MTHLNDFIGFEGYSTVRPKHCALQSNFMDVARFCTESVLANNSDLLILFDEARCTDKCDASAKAASFLNHMCKFQFYFSLLS